MPEQEAIVIELHDEMAVVESTPSSQCGGCHSQNSCQGGAAAKTVQALVLNPLGAQVGDRVVVSADPMSLLLGSLMIYVLPLFGLIIGASAGYLLTDPQSESNLYSLLGAVAGLGAAFALIAHLNPRFKNEQRFAPRIAEIL